MIPFVEAKHYTKHGKRRIDLVVLHTMESPEGIDTAENVSAWFAGKSKGEAPRTSAHYCVDSNSVVQCVGDRDIAWHAPGANHNGIGIEHAGRASQGRDGWSDDYSVKMLDRSAQLVADLCVRYDIPIEWVDVKGLLAGARGLTTHANVSLAFKKSTHTDPGPDFPFDFYLARVRHYAASRAPARVS